MTSRFDSEVRTSNALASRQRHVSLPLSKGESDRRIQVVGKMARRLDTVHGIGLRIARRLSRLTRRVRALHGDERGMVSIMTLATIIGLMMLLGLVLNVARRYDDKVKMQNAADAATYSGGVVLARGMNAIAFSNHLLCDTFALTAFMREARDRHSDVFISEILGAWQKTGTIFQRSDFIKFRKLGGAILAKLPLEKESVQTYSEMSALTSQALLPIFEHILESRLIPEFQRSVVRTLPGVAQQATNNVALRHGMRQPSRPQVGVLWRTMGQPVGYPDESDPRQRTLPAIDPSPGAAGGQRDPHRDPSPSPLEGADFQMISGSEAQLYLRDAIVERQARSRKLLNDWISDRMRFFDMEAKMSQYINLFRIFACGHLDRLLEDEYPTSNLPHMIRLADGGVKPDILRFGNWLTARPYLDHDFMFLGIAYRPKFRETFGGLFRSPLASDPQAFTQVHLFVPEPRWTYSAGGPIQAERLDVGGGGFGVSVPVSLPAPPKQNLPPGWYRESWPVQWDLFNQNWTAQIVPATTESLARLLQSQPPPELVQASTGPVRIRVPNFGGSSSQKLRNVNSH